MQKLAVLFFLLTLTPISVPAQSDCCNEPNRIEPGIDFLQALSLCYIESNEECFRMRPSVDHDQFPVCTDASLDNPHWYIFFPSTDVVQLDWTATNCDITGQGIQVAAYRLDPSVKFNDCADLALTDLQLVSTDCGDLETQGFFSGSVFLTNARNHIYYVLIDGFNSDECDYTINLAQGALRGRPLDSLTISGPTTVPEFYTATYTAAQLKFECYESYGCHCGMCTLDTFVVEWTAPPGAIISASPGSLVADITMGNTSGQVCATIQDDCINLSACIFIEVIPPEFFIKCPDEIITAHGQNFMDPGSYIVDEGDAVYEIIVENYAEQIEEVNLIGCDDERFFDCQQNEIIYPTTSASCTIVENDTCKTINYSISWTPTYFITQLDTICQGDSLLFCGTYIHQTDTYTCPATSVAGCDSITELVLTVTPWDTLIADAFVCDEPYYVLLQDTFYTSGVHVITSTHNTDCRDVYILHLVLLESDTFYSTDTLCANMDYTFCGETIDTPGEYICAYSRSPGCDSVVILNLVEPCSTRYLFYCPDEFLQVGDSLIDENGTYVLPRDLGNGCSCLDTFIIEYATMDHASIVASGPLTCSGGEVELHVEQVIDVEYSIQQYLWLDENYVTLGTAPTLAVGEAGTYYVVVDYLNSILHICQDTLSIEMTGEPLFNPSFSWIDKSDFICAAETSYTLSFETDAVQYTLQLIGGTSWINQSEIQMTLPAEVQEYNFVLTLASASGLCEEEIEFTVDRLMLSTTWPDTVFAIDDAITLPNAVAEAGDLANTIRVQPPGAITEFEDDLLLVQPVSGPITLSFNYGNCEQVYSTYIVRNAYYIPTAFSPNNDGINDEFTIYTSAGLEVIELSIFDRWGSRIYARSAGPFTWDGKVNGKAVQPGIFLVQYRITDPTGAEVTGVSELVLMR